MEADETRVVQQLPPGLDPCQCRQTRPGPVLPCPLLDQRRDLGVGSRPSRYSRPNSTTKACE